MKSSVSSIAFSMGFLYCLLSPIGASETVSLPAIPVCPDPLRLECPAPASASDAHQPCRCAGTVVKSRDEKCPNDSIALTPSASFASSSLRCALTVTDAEDGVCNHGMVLDVRRNMCMASRTMEALCRCPEDFSIHGQYCVKEIGSPTVVRRRLRNLFEDSANGEGGVRLIGKGIGRAMMKDLECRCPDGMFTAAQFKRRTSDSTVDLEEEEADKIVRPGHGGCVMVEYHEVLKKCTDKKGETTVDSDLNPTHTNDCTNTVIVLADKYCKQDEEGGEEKWVEKCAGPKAGGGRGFGFLVNDKHCWCEKKKVEEVRWECPRGGKRTIKRNANGVVTSASCESR
eukprot:GHVS01102723.1.p1 GENE.GHVS01102723.1~~GHVS01102723.1.p1  ORF type:complete len:342 (+),score=59.70 GHVS01102723.1:103-1128(+)